MKILRKCIAFTLAVGLMISAMTVFANSYSFVYQGDVDEMWKGGIYDCVIVDGDIDHFDYQGTEAPSENNIAHGLGLGKGDTWFNTATNQMWDYDGNNWIPRVNSCDSSDSSEAQPLTQEEIAAIQSQAEAAAVQSAASDEGFADVGDMYRAAEKGMSAGEYYNNAVTSTPGIENAITVGQGGNLVVNGVVTNMSATITKVTNRAYVDSVRIEQEGTVLNVVDVQYPAVEATINFYTPGITDGMEIVALQYNAGTWVNVEVAEVRADHVVLNMKGNGVVAFIAK